MSSQRCSPEFKDEAIRQILERGYSVTEVSERLGVSSHSLYKWVKAIIRQDRAEYSRTRRGQERGSQAPFVNLP